MPRKPRLLVPEATYHVHCLAETKPGGCTLPDRLRIALMVGVLAAVPALSAAGTSCETLYALTENASYVEGCFPPCACPLTEATRFRGTFSLGPDTIDRAIISQDVTKLYWIATIDAAEVEVTGTGVYRRSIGPSPTAHALDLDLTVDGREPQHFSSGWLPLASDDGSINIPVSIHGQTCHDALIVVDASTVPPEGR